MKQPQGELTVIPDAFDSVAYDGTRSLTIKDGDGNYFIGWVKPDCPLNEGRWRGTFPTNPKGTYGLT